MNIKLKDFVENSFLKPLLIIPTITDISFNGEFIFYMDNLKGRMKSDICISSNEVKDFIRQISNLSEKPFSFQNPYLDISIDKYRIFAVHDSIGRYKYENVVTFSIRIGNSENVIDYDETFFPNSIKVLLDFLIFNNISIVISGETSSGKTEFQKYLISRMKVNSRLIIIDNILELDSINKNEKLDIVNWTVNENLLLSNTKYLIRSALRNNPDWLLVAEARGEEMLDVLNARMSGHPIITTLHALDAKSVPDRIAMLIMLNDKKFNYENILNDIYYHFPIVVHLRKKINEYGNIEREIFEIIEIEKNGKINTIFQRKFNKPIFGKFSNNFVNTLQIEAIPEEIKDFFEVKYE